MEDKDLLEKLDAIITRIAALETPPDEDQKEDVDPRIEKAATAIRKTLKGSFTDEKLDAMSLEELLLASTLKEDFKPPVGINPPTGSGTPKEDAHKGIPDNMRAHFGSENKYGEVI